jgi:pimeloyl-ACP methyl ester carboxylesterase
MYSAGRSWIPLASAMADQGYCCYMPDLLGFGRSPWPCVEYTVAAHCEYLIDFMKDVLKHEHFLQPIHIVGHSMGALLAFELESYIRNLRGIAVPKSVILFATPYYKEEGDAVKSVHLTPKGTFVRFMIYFPGMSCLLCTVLCQQRW